LFYAVTAWAWWPGQEPSPEPAPEPGWGQPHHHRQPLRSGSGGAHLFHFGGGLVVHQFDLEDQVRIGGNGLSRALRAIAERGGHAETPGAALGHQLQAFGKAGDHAFHRKGGGVVLVEHAAVCGQIADVVDQHIIALGRMGGVSRRLERQRAEARSGLGAALALAGGHHRHQRHRQDRGGQRGSGSRAGDRLGNRLAGAARAGTASRTDETSVARRAWRERAVIMARFIAGRQARSSEIARFARAITPVHAP
jgi:hypothetical protein